MKINSYTCHYICNAKSLALKAGKLMWLLIICYCSLQVCRACGLLGYYSHKLKTGICSKCKKGDNISTMKLPYACKLLMQVTFFFVSLSVNLPSGILTDLPVHSFFYTEIRDVHLSSNTLGSSSHSFVIWIHPSGEALCALLALRCNSFCWIFFWCWF